MGHCKLSIVRVVDGRNVVACSVCGRPFYGQPATQRKCNDGQPVVKLPRKKCGSCGK